mmetsp:Transcript_44902/g.80893  ORF Transcript_44902/g.80893 Transcript_44902/m.80893 type:complete len:234 (+) Transcript_44902:97-798(+)
MSGMQPWQQRLCCAFCGPPIHKVHFTRTPLVDRELPRFTRAAYALITCGVMRSYLVNEHNLGDFLHGGGDMFSGILAMLALNDCCGANGSWFIGFMIWSAVNAIFFDLILGFFSNLTHAGDFCSGDGTDCGAFWIDELTIAVSIALQLYMTRKAYLILNDAVPHWANLATYGSRNVRDPYSSEPLLDDDDETPSRPAYSSWAPSRPASNRQPPSSGRSNFVPFGGSGQRLGSR